MLEMPLWAAQGLALLILALSGPQDPGQAPADRGPLPDQQQAPRATAAARAEALGLVTVEAGELPVLILAPHGGSEAIPDAAVRSGDGVASFSRTRDVGTAELAMRTADALEELTGRRPYLVVARFHRRYADANRPPAQAFEDAAAGVVYEAYHQALAAARGELQRRWGAGLVLDLHGQSAEPGAIFRGTQNGSTARNLVERFGRGALTGEDSLIGKLAALGFPQLPAVDSSAAEDPRYDGGYTVRTYGSGGAGVGVDAIQLELGRALREPAALAGTAAKLARAIDFARTHYLPEAERRTRVGVYCDAGASGVERGILRALSGFEDVEVVPLSAERIRGGALGDLDVLVQPGGSGGKQGRTLGEAGRERIRAFLREGGGYLGICAGAYLASADYSWSLHVLDARVLDRAHWARGKGTVELDLSPLGRRLLRTEAEVLPIHYAQGPLLAPAGDPELADFESLATFRTEIAKKGAPKGVMLGTTAVARGRYGRGRVLCFSPHPELTAGLDELLRFAIHDVARRAEDRPVPPAAPVAPGESEVGEAAAGGARESG
ncbi:MAG: N-formylglutamate amidohydrolase [Planctomycetota bacterium]|nr:N-formylglutamate amidohydrolase [Planctomycetota bacterium]